MSEELRQSETNEELLARYRSVKADHDKARKQMERMKLGSPNRDRKARWVGSLYFTLSGIESKIVLRDLEVPRT